MWCGQGGGCECLAGPGHNINEGNHPKGEALGALYQGTRGDEGGRAKRLAEQTNRAPYTSGCTRAGRSERSGAPRRRAASKASHVNNRQQLGLLACYGAARQPRASRKEQNRSKHVTAQEHFAAARRENRASVCRYVSLGLQGDLATFVDDLSSKGGVTVTQPQPCVVSSLRRCRIFQISRPHTRRITKIDTPLDRS